MEKDLQNLVDSVLVVEKTSKAGNKYFVLRTVLTGANGDPYVIDNFLSQDQRFIIDSMLSSLAN